VHHVYVRWQKQFNENENRRSQKFYRLWNEIPAAFMIIIVVMAVAEPFG